MKKLLAITTWFLASNWLWDVAHIVHYRGSDMLGNGLWTIPASTVYHLSWYSSIAAFFTLALYCIHLIKKYEEAKRCLENTQ